MSESQPVRRSRRRQAVIVAAWTALLAVSFVVVLALNGDIHLGKSGPPADHSAYVALTVGALACHAEPFELRDNETERQRPIYSCVNHNDEWRCLIEDQGLVANATRAVQRLFRDRPNGHRPRCVT